MNLLDVRSMGVILTLVEEFGEEMAELVFTGLRIWLVRLILK